MKASNDLIKKFGVDKIIHGLIGMLILAVCVIASVFLFGVNFFSVLGGMILGTVSAWLAGKWKESKDDVPDAADIRATVRGALLADVVILTGMDSLPPDSITRMYHEKATRTVMDRSFPVRIRNDPAVLRVLGSSHRAD